MASAQCDLSREENELHPNTFFYIFTETPLSLPSNVAVHSGMPGRAQTTTQGNNLAAPASSAEQRLRAALERK